MAYGIEFFNEQGEEILEYQRTLYVRREGSTIPQSQFWAEADADAVAQGISDTTPSPIIVADLVARQVTATAGVCYPANGKGVLLPRLEDQDPLDMTFYRMGGPGLLTHVQQYVEGWGEIPEGGFAYCQTEGDAPIDYLIVSTDVPTSGTENYGLEVRDENNVVTFDSRQSLFTVFQVEQITKTQMDDVVLNGAVIDIPLNKAAPNCCVSLPFFCSFRITVSGPSSRKLSRVMIEQTSDTNLRLSRVETTVLSEIQELVAYSDVPRTFTQDALLFIARDFSA